MDKCFAYDTIDGIFRCRALLTDTCEGKGCPFFKTEEECIFEKFKTNMRLEQLPPEQREAIKKKYGV